MTVTVQVYAGDCFRLIEAKTFIKFCIICNRHFNRTV